MSSDKRPLDSARGRQATCDMQHGTSGSLLLVACCLLLPLTGCVYRSLTIKTEPPGAKIYVNDTLVGQSPVTYDFVWYGWHRLTLRKDGFERLDDRKLLRAPVWSWIPFDLMMELLPLPIHDRRVWSYTLAPAPVMPTPQAPPLESSGAAPPAPAPSTTTTPSSMSTPSPKSETAPPATESSDAAR